VFSFVTPSIGGNAGEDPVGTGPQQDAGGAMQAG
jgi:hypothetical protein